MKKNSEAVLPEGGFFVRDLEASLAATLQSLAAQRAGDLLTQGWTIRDLVQVVATTPPFNDVLTKRVQQSLRAVGTA